MACHRQAGLRRRRSDGHRSCCDSDWPSVSECAIRLRLFRPDKQPFLRVMNREVRCILPLIALGVEVLANHFLIVGDQFNGAPEPRRQIVAGGPVPACSFTKERICLSVNGSAFRLIRRPIASCPPVARSKACPSSRTPAGRHAESRACRWRRCARCCGSHQHRASPRPGTQHSERCS